MAINSVQVGLYFSTFPCKDVHSSMFPYMLWLLLYHPWLFYSYSSCTSGFKHVQANIFQHRNHRFQWHPSFPVLTTESQAAMSQPRSSHCSACTSYQDTGWWLSPTPLKNMTVNWEKTSQYMEIHKIPYINHVFPYINHIFMINQYENMF